MLPVATVAKLSSPSSSTTPVTMSSKYPTKIVVKVGEELKEFPVSYFKKTVLRKGRWSHNKTGQKFNFTDEDLNHYQRQVNEMIEEGLEIPTPFDHRDDQEPKPKNPYFVSSRDNMGFVVQAMREGDDLNLIQAAIGEDAALTAVRNRASVWIKPFKDCTGRDWGSCIVHSAYTPIPVMHGLGPHTSLAASRESESDAFEFSRETETPMKISEAQKKRLKALALSMGKKQADVDTMDDEALIQCGIEYVEKMDDKLKPDELLGESKLLKASTDKDATIATLNTEKTALNQRLAKEQPEEPDERTVGLSKRLAHSDVDGAVAAKKFSPATGEKIKAAVDDEPLTLALDREGGKAPLHKTLIDIAETAAKTPAPGEKKEEKKTDKKLDREVPPGETDEEEDKKPENAAKKAGAAIRKNLYPGPAAKSGAAK